MTKEMAEKIQEKIKNNEIQMKPHYYFVLGTLSLGLGITGSFILTIFLTTALFYRIRMHGLQCALSISNIPWVLLFLTMGFFTLGIYLFKKYDISYKTSVLVITILLAITVLSSGYIIDKKDIHRPFRRSPFINRLFEDKPKGVGMRENERKLSDDLYQIRRENSPTKYRIFDTRGCQ